MDTDREIMFSDLDKKLIRELQEDLPLVSEPFQMVGEGVGMSEVEILDKIKKWKKEEKIRRFGAVVRHQKLGIRANAMGVWKADPERVEEAGKIMASFPQVSHCYQRATLPGWDYNLYTMIHGETREECERIAQEISTKTGIKEYRLLYSVREFKKASMEYFSEKVEK